MNLLFGFFRPLDWSRISERNICFVSYSEIKKGLIRAVKTMVNEHLIEFIAKVIGDFILAIDGFKLDGVHDMSHVEIVGFSMGAHIAAFACRYLYFKTGTQVKFLLGINAKNISNFNSFN